MVTEKEMKAIYGHMNEDELRNQMTKVADKMSHLYKRYNANLFAGDVRGVDVVNRLLHSAHVKMATIASMLHEAKKRGLNPALRYLPKYIVPCTEIAPIASGVSCQKSRLPVDPQMIALPCFADV